MSANAKLVETIPAGNTLGECILWRDSDHTVWWTDVQENHLHRISYPDLKVKTYKTPQRLCAFSFVEDTDEVILAAFESGLALFTPEDGSVTWLSQPRELARGIRLNDGRTDPSGRFWVGSVVEDPDADSNGQLYAADDTGDLHSKRDGIRISNGICWAPDGRTMYFADSHTRKIQKTTYATGTGSIGDWVPFLEVETGDPDGAITDADGIYWFAHWGEARVVGVSPQGQVIGHIDTPACQPTCPALGGPNGNLLFVTSARQGLCDDAMSENDGNLFVFETSLTSSPSNTVRATLKTHK